MVNATPRPLYPPGKIQHPLYRRSGRVRKISPAPGFDPRTVQPVASRYTVYAIPQHVIYQLVSEIGFKSFHSATKTLSVCVIPRSPTQRKAELRCGEDA